MAIPAPFDVPDEAFMAFDDIPCTSKKKWKWSNMLPNLNVYHKPVTSTE
jgi:hypothetical protein